MKKLSFLLVFTLLLGATSFAIPNQVEKSITEQTGVYDVGINPCTIDASFAVDFVTTSNDHAAIPFENIEAILPVNTNYRGLRFKGHNAKHNKRMLRDYGKNANRNYTITITDPVAKVIQKEDLSARQWQEVITEWIELAV